MTLTWPDVLKHSPCSEAVEWGKVAFDGKESVETVELFERLIRDERLDWANWMIVRCMGYKRCVSYAVFAAEQVVWIYEKQYPEDSRPREAIETARRCVEDPTDKNKAAARTAVEASVWAAWAVGAARTAAGAAGEASVWAAWAAGTAVEASVWAARTAAEASVWAAWSAGTAGAVAGETAKRNMQLKILNYGIGLLNGSQG